MSFTSSENPQTVEALVNTLETNGATLSEANLSALSSSDLVEQLAQLSHDLHLSPNPESLESDTEMVESEEVCETVEEVVQSDMVTEEVEIETEHSYSPEEALPDTKFKTTIPPLRPLTIAPKPTKVPITLKPVSSQQLLLFQGSGGGQPIKLMSPQGQALSLANISLGKAITLRPTIKTVTAPSNISVAQTKQILMRKVTTQQQKTTLVADASQGSLIVTQNPEVQIKATSSQANVMPNPTKTITLAQAQQMGLLAGAKLVQQSSTKQAVMIKQQPNKAIKVMPQNKQPAKILPAPLSNPTGKNTQRIILKQTNAGGAIMAPGQIIQVTGTHGLAAGQLHQINIPGKGMQYIKFVSATNAESTLTTSATNVPTRISTQGVPVGNKLVSMPTLTSTGTAKPANVVLSQVKAVGAANNLVSKTLKPANLAQPTTVQLSQSASGQLVMLPTSYLQQPAPAKLTVRAKTPPPKPPAIESPTPVADVNMDANGMRPRKPCNCTKSQCLKLYCDCFANGEFCYLCNCMNCYNNLSKEEHRQRAIKSCLERNPNAFRPKIGKAKDTGDTPIRKHTKGCNCKRSGCLKNYCECYEAKIACSSNCKCMGCRNIEDSMDKKGLQPKMDVGIVVNSPTMVTSKLNISRSLLFRSRRHSNSKYAFNFITDDVIEATCQCLLTISDSAEASAQNEEVTKLQIIEEFGRCLKEIIDCSADNSITPGPS